MLIFFSILQIFTSSNISHNIMRRSIEPTSTPLFKNKVNYVLDNIDTSLKIIHVDNFMAATNKTTFKNTLNCTKNFNFKPKNINNIINFQTIFIASDIVFEALMSNRDLYNIIRKLEKRSIQKGLYDLRLIFRKFIKNFILKQKSSKRLKPIGQLLELLAYHSYDLVFDLSFYPSFDNLEEMGRLKNFVNDHIDLQISSSCPWHIIQLYSKNLYINRENKLDYHKNERSLDKINLELQEIQFGTSNFDDNGIKDIYSSIEDF
ncbi:uncharacterized protein VNE69_03370 [Vairimorpha necatrix]|uniref:Uncharacterized protein n=1 Tax=Vairimorpha necatrix TaxID=6039 RepID=A0AAX4JB53_9MICR